MIGIIIFLIAYLALSEFFTTPDYPLPDADEDYDELRKQQIDAYKNQ